MNDRDLDMLLDAARKDTIDDAAVARIRKSVAGAGFAVVTAGGLKKAFWSTKLVAWLFGAATIAAGVTVWANRAPPAPEDDAVVLPAERTPSALPSPLAIPIHSVAPHDVASEPSATALTPPLPPSPREGLLLLQARRKLDADPQAARDLVRQHEREFPNSQLAHERSTIANEAEARGAR